jgi:glycosyltransferase involved in cell wall biosynthesis
MRPLVSILIPAYNAEAYLGYTLQSAVAQTWARKEIIVIDDGSKVATVAVANSFSSKVVKVVSIENQGQCAALNHAYRLCQGDYIQELDADDLLSPDKIERQLDARHEGDSKRLLLSSPWAHFYFRPERARFIPNSLWQDLSPAEWLMTKMGKNLHMQPATWLTSRELAEAAGPWDETLHYDQDGEYFARVVRASEGTRFVPEGKVYYRASSSGRVSYLGNSDKKRNSLLRSMKLHMQYLLSIEESARTRAACLAYFQTWLPAFYPQRPDVVAELQELASQMGGHLEEPRLNWKYAWLRQFVGWDVATNIQNTVPEKKASFARLWDKTMFKLESGRRTVPTTEARKNLPKKDEEAAACKQ